MVDEPRARRLGGCRSGPAINTLQVRRRYAIFCGMTKKPVATQRALPARLEELRAWAGGTEQEISELVGSMAPLQERLEAARERLDLIRRLIGLAERDASGRAGEQHQVEGRRRDANQPEVVLSTPRAGGDVEDHIEGILEAAGEPVHIRDIRQALIERGVPLPGRGDEANLIVRLRRDAGRFTRTGRGKYALSKWGLAAVEPSKTRRVVRKKSGVSR